MYLKQILYGSRRMVPMSPRLDAWMPKNLSSM